jgi:DNA-binding Xre family transcriptional regulator
MRLRLPEVLDERGLTGYAVVQLANGRISTTALYRLMQRKGRVRYIDGELLETLCEVLGVEPGDLLERDTKRSRTKRP